MSGLLWRQLWQSDLRPWQGIWVYSVGMTRKDPFVLRRKSFPLCSCATSRAASGRRTHGQQMVPVFVEVVRAFAKSRHDLGYTFAMSWAGVPNIGSYYMCRAAAWLLPILKKPLPAAQYPEGGKSIC